MFGKQRVNIGFPVDHLNQIVEVTDPVGRAVFPEQVLRNNCIPYQGLVHGKDIRGKLWLVGAQAARRMQYAGRDVQARPGASR